MKDKHPMQPVYIDDHGTARFKPNQIIEWLFKTAGWTWRPTAEGEVTIGFCDVITHD
jgi:hypothetical protein